MISSIGLNLARLQCQRLAATLAATSERDSALGPVAHIQGDSELMTVRAPFMLNDRGYCAVSPANTG